MQFRQREGPSGKLAPGLARWCAETQPQGSRSVLVRIPASADPERAAAALERSGATVGSAGGSVITADVTQPALLSLAEYPWVLSVDEPTQYFPR